MNRKKILDYIDYMFGPDDVLIYVGNILCGEITEPTRDCTLCFTDDLIDYFSLSLGIAMTTEKRVVVVCEDYYVLRHFKSLLQIAVSECKNMVVLVLVSGKYIDAGDQPTIFNSLRSPKGVFMNLGVLTHDYTNYFKNKDTLKSIIDMLKTFNTPVISLINVSSDRLYRNTIFKNDMIRVLERIREK